MPANKSIVTTKVATLALPTREAHVVANVLPGPNGMLLFLAELNLAPQTRQDFLQNINAEIERSWQEAKLATGPVDATLETIITGINTLLLGSERLLGNPLTPRYQLLLAHLSGQQVALASLGHCDAFVINKSKLVSALTATNTKKAHKPSATFDHLISGELLPGESLLLATPSLTDYFSLEKLRQQIAERAPGLALREIERYMLQLKVHPPLGLIGLQLALVREADGTHASMDHLLQTKANTASLLQPKLFGYLKNKLKPLKSEAKSSAAEPVKQLEPIENSRRLPEIRTKKISLINKIINFLRQLRWLTKRDTAKATIAWWLEAKLQQWRRLPTAKKTLLILGIIVLLAFSQSIVNLGRSRLKTIDSEYYNQLITEITEKQAEIEAALIYGDDAKAFNLYNEVSGLLNTLPKNSRSREVQWQALEQGLAHLTRRIQRLSEITELAVWSELPPLPSTNSWKSLAAINNALVVTNDAGQIVALAPDGKVAATINNPAEFGNAALIVNMEKELLLINSNKQALIYNSESKKINSTTLPFDLVSGSFYGNNLYYLSKDNRSIWRSAKQGVSFSTPVLWLRASQGNLSEALSLTVDGSIYVNTANQVNKFSRGQKQDFNLSAITPPLSSIVSINTLNESDYLYLWEQTNKRLIAYDKGGQLIIQLTFPALNNITSVTVNSTTKTVYLLAGNQIYQVPLLAAN